MLLLSAADPFAVVAIVYSRAKGAGARRLRVQESLQLGFIRAPWLYGAATEAFGGEEEPRKS